jgi:hypothetical protein|tara:strand:- start:989 stop:1375 length:387 start_codon:yes stop_codon:yes gene_type:complete
MAKQGLYANINAKKKAGTSNTKKKSTITPEAYANMQAGFPKKKKKAMYGGKMTMPKKKMLSGGQVKLDVAEPKGKLTAADFKELGNKGKMYGGKMKKPTKKMYGGSMKKPSIKKMYGGKMHMNKKKGK